MSEVRQGDVYWFDFGPAIGSAPPDRRPCVIVQSDVFNRSLIATTVVCPITSNLSRGQSPGNVVLKAGEANLPKPSVVNITQIFTVNKVELEEQIGRLSARIVDEIRSGLELLFDRA